MKYVTVTLFVSASKLCVNSGKKFEVAFTVSAPAAVVGASVVGASVVGASVVGASVVGASVVGASVVGASVVGASVVGASVVGASVVGASVVGATVVGASVVGASVAGSYEGSSVPSYTYATLVIGTDTSRISLPLATVSSVSGSSCLVVGSRFAICITSSSRLTVVLPVPTTSNVTETNGTLPPVFV